MSKRHQPSSPYPDPIPLPSKVYAARAKRNKEIIRSAKIGISVRTAIIIFELIGVFLIGSSALLMDAIAGLVDIVSTLFLILCIRLAQRPPDEDHPFGHGRFEPLGGLILGLLLAVTGFVMFIQQAFTVVKEDVYIPLSPYGWIFPLVAMLLLEGCYRYIISIARNEKSPALVADAYHYRIDGLTSLFATVALVIGAFWPHWSVMVDYIGAFVIALFMIGMGIFASRENFFQLVDKVPEEELFTKVREASAKVPGVLGTEKIRIQTYGPDAHVDIDIEVEPQLSVDLAHGISQKVRAEIQKAWPAVRDVTVHIEPYYANDH